MTDPTHIIQQVYISLYSIGEIFELDTIAKWRGEYSDGKEYGNTGSNYEED